MSNHADKNLIAHLSNLDGRSFGNLLSRTILHTIVGMGKTRGQCNKENLVRRETKRNGEF
jgi:hypothetical protein